MAKIEKLKKDVEGVSTTIYPVTIPQAVIDPASGKSSRVELDEKANHGYESDPKTLKVVDDAKADHGYESNPKSLKEVDDAKANHGYESNPKSLKEVDDEKVDKSSIVGETGQGETTVMHQKAVTDELSAKAGHGYESNPKSLKEVDDEKAAHGYGAEPQKTLKEVDTLAIQNAEDISQLAGDVKDTTEKAGAASLAELNARLLALEKIVSSSLRSTIEVTREFNVWGKTNLILYGDGANTKAPDFIGQKYIDTTGKSVYVAVGVTNSGDWKLV